MTDYTLQNPHDDWRFEAVSDEVAEAAVVTVSGMYGWERTDDPSINGGFLEMLALGKSEAEVDEMMSGVKDVIENHRADLIEALRSFHIHEGRERSSLTDPGARAAQVADALAAAPAFSERAVDA